MEAREQPRSEASAKANGPGGFTGQFISLGIRDRINPEYCRDKATNHQAEPDRVGVYLLNLCVNGTDYR